MNKAEFFETVDVNLLGAQQWSAEDRIRAARRVVDALDDIDTGVIQLTPELEDHEYRSISCRASDALMHAGIELKLRNLDTTRPN